MTAFFFFLKALCKKEPLANPVLIWPLLCLGWFHYESHSICCSWVSTTKQHATFLTTLCFSVFEEAVLPYNTWTISRHRIQTDWFGISSIISRILLKSAFVCSEIHRFKMVPETHHLRDVDLVLEHLWPFLW